MGLARKDMRILVVEDETDLKDLITENLKNAGFEQISSAANGHDAYNVCTQTLRDKKPIDLIISDCNMPKMSGADFLEKIRKNQLLSEVQFIMLTANGDRNNIERAVKLGVDQYLVKPVNFEMLMSRVETILKKKGMAD